jgi:hypothetical protein
MVRPPLENQGQTRNLLVDHRAEFLFRLMAPDYRCRTPRHWRPSAERSDFNIATWSLHLKVLLAVGVTIENDLGLAIEGKPEYVTLGASFW